MKYGLFFGINNYAHGITPLSCARNDAESFFRTFKAEGYEGKLLTDAPAGTSPEQYKQQLLAEGYAPSDIHVCNMTSADVRNALNNIPSMKKGDLLVIFFSGHGFEINGKNCLIRRGVPVKIKRKFADVLEQSHQQDIAVLREIERLEADYRTKETELA